MAVRTWKGGTGTSANRGTVKVQMTSTLVIASNTNTHTFIVSATNPTGTDTATTVTILTVTANGVLTTDELATAVALAWNTSTHEFAMAVTASAASSTVTFTADVAGIPFIISKSGTGTSTLTSNVIANQGPNDYSVPSNWVEGIVPVANDTVVITNHPNGQPFDILYGLAQSTVALDEFQVTKYSGTIGSFVAPLHFDIDDRFLFNAASAVGYFKLVSGATVVQANIESTGNKDGYGCHLDGSATINLLAVSGGSVWVGYRAGGMLVDAVDNSGGKLRGTCTITTLKQASGESILAIPFTGGVSTMAGVSLDDGYVYLETTATITLITVNGGLLDFKGTSPTIETLTCNGGTTDLAVGKQSLAVTTANLRQGAVLRFDTAYVTVTTFNRTGPVEYRSPSEANAGRGGR